DRPARQDDTRGRSRLRDGERREPRPRAVRRPRSRRPHARRQCARGVWLWRPLLRRGTAGAARRPARHRGGGPPPRGSGPRARRSDVAAVDGVPPRPIAAGHVHPISPDRVCPESITLYLQEFKVGDTFQFAPHTFTRDEIITFGRQYDPQPFHVDEAAASASIYGGLIASGWQTVGVTFRLAVEGLIHRVASMGSPGVDEVRWLKPVRPGDTVTASGEVLEVRPSASKPDRGVIRVRYQAVNQRGETVLTM